MVFSSSAGELELEVAFGKLIRMVASCRGGCAIWESASHRGGDFAVLERADMLRVGKLGCASSVGTRRTVMLLARMPNDVGDSAILSPIGGSTDLSPLIFFLGFVGLYEMQDSMLRLEASPGCSEFLIFDGCRLGQLNIPAIPDR